MQLEGNTPQDTTRLDIDAILLNAGFANPKPDTAGINTLYVQSPVSLPAVPDSLISCPRNQFAFYSFADSLIPVRTFRKYDSNSFPYQLVNSSIRIHKEKYIILKNVLKEGRVFKTSGIYNDWMLIIILVSALLYSLIRSTSKTFFHDVFKSAISFGSRKDISRDLGGLFQWQSTLGNLVTFLNIGLFIILILKYYALSPGSISQILLLGLICLAVIIAVTIRHLICEITGNISGRTDAFREYLYSVYQAYRLFGLILFLLIIFISFTDFLLPEIYFIAGGIIMALFYFMRIIRLLIIFINRNISIFYFILYLCALEILPAVVIIKFLTGSI